MADINTDVPAWLQRNWTPKEPFDPTPWLQEGYRRSVEQQKLPLQLQQMALQNEASRLAIEHQGIVNEQVGMDLQGVQEDLPAYKDALDQAAKTPGGALAISPSFRSKQMQDRWLARQHQDASTLYGQTLKEKIIQDTKRAAEAMSIPGAPTLVPDPRTGMFNPEELALAEQYATTYKAHQLSEKLQEQYGYRYTTDENGNVIPTALAVADTKAQAQEKVAKIRANAVPGAMVEPVVKEFEGQKFLVNPKNNHWEHLDKHKTRSDFIESHALKWATDNMMTPEAAADALGKFYDQSLAPKGAGSTSTNAPSGLQVYDPIGRTLKPKQ